MAVEALARRLGGHKSSVYHYFSDREVFTEALLAQHLRQAKALAAKEARCTSIDPELVAHQDDLLFSRPLRTNTTDARFRQCFETAAHIVRAPFLQVWIHELNIPMSSAAAEALFGFVLDHFLLQLCPETLTSTGL